MERPSLGGVGGLPLDPPGHFPVSRYDLCANTAMYRLDPLGETGKQEKRRSRKRETWRLLAYPLVPSHSVMLVPCLARLPSHIGLGPSPINQTSVRYIHSRYIPRYIPRTAKAPCSSFSMNTNLPFLAAAIVNPVVFPSVERSSALNPKRLCQ